jgi:23S rRNA-/tRNA-specific pseudouridylate synthase
MSIDLRIVYRLNGLIAVDKPPGLSVHAAPGPSGSVLKELLTQTGISELTPVHRLDRDASGVLLFAETKALAATVQRTWEQSEKSYLALCDGVPEQLAGTIDAPILEHQTGKPERMRNALRYFASQHPDIEIAPLPAPKTSAVHAAGRASQTAYRVIESFGAFSLLELKPSQGRMHQIRVHLAHAGFPLAVDGLYGKRTILRECDAGGSGEAVLLERMPLHAAKLTFAFGGERITVEAALPGDMAGAIAVFRGIRVLNVHGT